MYHQSSKRRQLIARTLVYSFMTISVIAIVTILMFIILGYSFNRKDGRIEQGGLLQFASVPSGARVTLDGSEMATRTPSKASVDAKGHTVTMKLDGYRDWQKSINVDAGGIGWLSYTRFVPNDITPESLRSFPRIAASLASTDRHFIAIQEDAAQPLVTLVNIESTTPKYTTLSLPASLPTAATTDAPQTYSMENWGNGDDFILIKRTYDTDKTEWFVLDRAHPEKSVNINTSFTINPSKVIFGDRGGRTLFVRTDDTVREVNLDDEKLSGPLVENIDDFSIYDQSTIVYTTKPDTTNGNLRYVGYRNSSMDTAQTLFNYAGDTPNVHIAMGKYFGKIYVAISHSYLLDLYAGSLPTKNSKGDLQPFATKTLTTLTTRLTIGNNGRFAVAQSDNGYATYDIELKKLDAVTFARPATVQRNVQWLDDYMIWNDRQNMLRFYEFDGANQQDIMPTVEGQVATLNGDGKYIYAVASSDKGMSLERAKLILN